ncbi:unnamed protein product, partial [Mesorhabditis belari]|uniref:Uncharacterized protein n=1 Tax=Mesorhabditis belari TaxID=2138241 RepID=A0AAF3FR10_9BILA
MVFGSHAPVPHVMTLSNQHPSESMLCVVFPPLPKESYEKPFAGAIWRTVLNRWKLHDNNGWVFKTTIETFAKEEFKTMVLKPGETRRTNVWANNQGKDLNL